MWRMESSFRLDEARFIGVGNPESIYNCQLYISVKGSFELRISSKYCAQLPPILELWVHCCLYVSGYNSSLIQSTKTFLDKIIMLLKLSDTAKKERVMMEGKAKRSRINSGFLLIPNHVSTALLWYRFLKYLSIFMLHSNYTYYQQTICFLGSPLIWVDKELIVRVVAHFVVNGKIWDQIKKTNLGPLMNGIGSQLAEPAWPKYKNRYELEKGLRAV